MSIFLFENEEALDLEEMDQELVDELQEGEELDYGDLEESTVELVTTMASLNEAAMIAEFTAQKQALRESDQSLYEASVKETLKKWWEKIKAALAKAWTAIKNFFGRMWERLKNLFTTNAKWYEQNKEALASVSFSGTVKAKVPAGLVKNAAATVAKLEQAAAGVVKGSTASEISNGLDAFSSLEKEHLKMEDRAFSASNVQAIAKEFPILLTLGSQIKGLEKYIKQGEAQLKTRVSEADKAVKRAEAGDKTAAQEAHKEAQAAQKAVQGTRESMKIITKAVNAMRSGSMKVMKAGLAASKSGAKKESASLFETGSDSVFSF